MRTQYTHGAEHRRDGAFIQGQPTSRKNPTKTDIGERLRGTAWTDVRPRSLVWVIAYYWQEFFKNAGR